MENISAALKSIYDNFDLKAVGGITLSLFTGKYPALFLGFMALIFLDCLTKWIALSYENLTANGLVKPTFFDAICGMARARRERLIDSTTMRKRGLSKIFSYCLTISMAATCDYMTDITHAPLNMLGMTVAYMVINEALSIVENLSDAGVGSLTKLTEIISKRLGKL